MGNVINRTHNFTNRLDKIEKKRRYFYLWHEKDIFPIRIEINSKLDRAFIDENWATFEEAEAKYYGGEVENV